MVYPPPTGAFARIDSGFHEIIQRCPRPVMAVPRVVSPLTHALLAYDGSPKGQEALFVATYLAGAWKIPLTVITVFEDGRFAPETLMKARVYLEDSNIEAEFVAGQGQVGAAILKETSDRQADFLILGGYGHTPMLDVVLGSTVDQVLRETQHPVLICR
jgi:nucleotide-binding universal stress UspA family protein